MKNRMAFTGSRQDPPSPEASGSDPLPGDQVGVERFHGRLSEAWRAWEAASSSEFFNWFVFRPHRSPVATPPALLEDWIYFQGDAWELDARARTTLTRRMSLFQTNRKMRIVIGGLASHPETPEDGMTLGLRRALSIRSYLVGHGIDPNRVGIAIRGTGWFLRERANGPDDPDTPHSECRLQVTDSHWALARN